MTEKEYKALMRDKWKEREDKKTIKRSKQLYYTTQSLMGIEWWTWAWLCGSRGRGKSFAVIDINPNYEIKFHLRPRRSLPILRSIPFLRNFYITAAYYLISSSRSSNPGSAATAQ